MNSQYGNKLSARYVRLIEATGLEVEELDRQAEYVIDAMDILAQEILRLEKRLEVSDGIKPLDSMALSYRAKGVKVRVNGAGTYLFPEDTRVSISTGRQIMPWSFRVYEERGREVLHVNGPSFAIHPRAANDINLRSED